MVGQLIAAYYKISRFLTDGYDRLTKRVLFLAFVVWDFDYKFASVLADFYPMNFDFCWAHQKVELLMELKLRRKSNESAKSAHI